MIIRAGPSMDLRRDTELRRLQLTDTAEVRVDLAAVETADARTVGALVSLARAAHGALSVDRLSPHLRRALAQSGVLQMIAGGTEG